MTAPAWMPFYVADYLADTGHLTTLEHGAYLLLIMHYWQNSGLPQDDAKLARIARMPLQDWQGIADTIRALFGPGWTHKRIDAERARSAELTGKRRAAGRAGAVVRHGNRRANAEQTQSKPLASAIANAEHSLSISQPQLQTTAPLPQNSGPGARTRPDLDRIEAACRAAAGLENEPSPALKDLSPILTLLDRGYDLDRDILPILKSRNGGKQRSWRYFLPAIEDAAKANQSISARPTATPKDPNQDMATWEIRRPTMARRQEIPRAWQPASAWPAEIRDWPETKQLLRNHANTTGEGWELGMSQH